MLELPAKDWANPHGPWQIIQVPVPVPNETDGGMAFATLLFKNCTSGKKRFDGRAVALAISHSIPEVSKAHVCSAETLAAEAAQSTFQSTKFPLVNFVLAILT